jgi:hypothetical protein
MGKYISYKRAEKEINIICDVFHECKNLTEEGAGYSKLSLTKLSSLYAQIENGLIAFNVLFKNFSEEIQEMELAAGEEKIEGFLESQLLGVAVSAIIKNPSHALSQEFKESLWNQKIKNKEYYNQLCGRAGIEDKIKDKIYAYLHE